MKRRDLILGGVFAGAASLLPFGARAAIPSTRTGTGRPARNVIFFVYDGLTWEDVALAQAFTRRRENRTLALERLLRAGRAGIMQTYSLTSLVTDSSAASSAWSTGRKIVNGMVNVFPDGTKLTPVLEIARTRGRATGLITTTRITHATPACWIAHVPNRYGENEIAEQYLDFRPDLLLGGGARHFGPDYRTDGRDLAAKFAAAGYSVLRTAEDLDRTNASRVLGIFHETHMPFEIDRRFQAAGGPSLARMTRRGLEIMAGDSRGFVLQIEAGRVDHSNHKNDVAATLWDMLAADEALAVVLDFVDAHPDTLLIMASDHATGGGAVYGVGLFYRESDRVLDRVGAHTASFEHLLARLGPEPDRDDIAHAVREYTGVSLLPNQAEIVHRAIDDGVRAANAMAYNDQPENSLAHVLYGGGGGRHPDRLNVNFATGQHTAAPVPVALYGPAAADRNPSFIDNTVLFEWMLDALGTRFENPIMSESEARELLAAPAARPETVHAGVA